MDIELLSRMVGELILQHDQVGLPGVGTFVAEMVPASFSDKGYTINPPYRRLSFTPKNLEDSLLIDFYATSNGVAREPAGLYLTQYLAEMKSVLEERKTIILPGLGRLRATRENTLFFVADEGLDIFPAGLGLRPVSLKSHVLNDDPVVIEVPIPVAPVPVPEPVPEETPEETPVETPMETPVETLEETPEETPVESLEEIPEEPVLEEIPEEPVPEPMPEPILETEAPAGEVPEAIPEEGLPVQSEDMPADEGPAEREEELPVRRGWPAWAVVTVVLLSLAIVALATFLILAHVAPDFIDSLLYSPEELQILNY